jgi:hypothetical protein
LEKEIELSRPYVLICMGSSMLRSRTAADRARELQRFGRDLRVAAKLLDRAWVRIRDARPSDPGSIVETTVGQAARARRAGARRRSATCHAGDRAPHVRRHPDSRAGRRSVRARRVLAALAVLLLALALLLARLPSLVRDYVQAALDQNQHYDGRIGELEIDLWRGGYTVSDVRIFKTDGSVPVPFFSASRIELSLEPRALLRGSFAGRMRLERPELNFVDAADSANSQTGSGGPWLAMIRDLFPFRIDSAEVEDGRVHFRAFDSDPPVDVYLSSLEGSVEDLTNIQDDLTPLFARIALKARVMDDAKIELDVALDPFSYRPTFELALRMIGLDVVRLNALSRAYAGLDFERGWFDLVVELDVKEGAVDGYVKPLFRDAVVFDLRADAGEDPLQTTWEAAVQIAAKVFENPPRRQVGTLVPLSGRLDQPRPDLLAALANVLYNAFTRAYLPNLHGAESPLEATVSAERLAESWSR